MLEEEEIRAIEVEQECLIDEDCRWFGGICMSGDLIDPEEIPLSTAPPTGYKCVCREGRCIAIRKEGLSPDLIVGRFLITRFAEDGVEIRFAVKNIGDAAITGMVNIKFINLENNQILKSVDLPAHPPIHPSEGRTSAPRRITGITTDRGGFVAGKNRIQMIVDYKNEIEEVNENNNKKVVIFDTREEGQLFMIERIEIE